MDLDSSSEDGANSTLNFVDDVVEGRLDNTTTNLPTRVENDGSDEDEGDEDSQSSTDNSDEGSVIGGVPSRKPELDDYAFVDQVCRVPLSVRAPPPDRPWQYKSYDVGISRIIREVERGGQIAYIVQTRDHRVLEVRESLSLF